jgi:hypothetical protein
MKDVSPDKSQGDPHIKVGDDNIRRWIFGTESHVLRSANLRSITIRLRQMCEDDNEWSSKGKKEAMRSKQAWQRTTTILLPISCSARYPVGLKL